MHGELVKKTNENLAYTIEDNLSYWIIISGWSGSEVALGMTEIRNLNTVKSFFRLCMLTFSSQTG